MYKQQQQKPFREQREKKFQVFKRKLMTYKSFSALTHHNNKENSFYIIAHRDFYRFIVNNIRVHATYHVVVVGVHWLAVASKPANSVAI